RPAEEVTEFPAESDRGGYVLPLGAGPCRMDDQYLVRAHAESAPGAGPVPGGEGSAVDAVVHPSKRTGPSENGPPFRVLAPGEVVDHHVHVGGIMQGHLR